ncbi:MAG: formate dehydrogenase subunit gamma [Steroidobacteraceae bacterium]
MSQIDMPELDAKQLEIVREALARHQGLPGPLLEVLHAIQAAVGHIPPAAVPVIAESLNLSRAEVHGVISFYHYFRDRPAGKHLVQVCRAEACQSMAANSLADHARRKCATDFHGTSADGRFSLEAVYCFGNCACAPAVMVDGELHGRVTPQRFDELLAAAVHRS